MRQPEGSSSTLEWARYYLDHGWRPVPVPNGQKGPLLKKWPELRLEQRDLPKHFKEGSNIGLLLGKPSGALGDVDLDSLEAVALAPKFLPNTDLIHGRARKQKSHWWYQCRSDLQYEKFTDEDGTTLVELRSRTGYQTIVPPSIHPSGEKLFWFRKGKPASVDGEELRSAVAELAACALVARHWPEIGIRNDAARALAGFLLRGGFSEEQAWNFIKNAATAANDEEVQKREQAVQDTAKKIAAGEKVTGGPTLTKLLRGDGKKVVEKLRSWLKLGDQDSPYRQQSLSSTSSYLTGGKAGKDSDYSKIPLISSKALAESPEDNSTEWLVDRFIPRGAVVALMGLPGSFKTWFALILAYCVARDKPFLGRSTAIGRVAYIDKENPQNVLKDRIRDIGSSKKLKLWPNWNKPDPPLLGDRRYLKLAANRSLLIFDSLRRFHRANENLSHEMAPVFESLRELTKNGTTVLFLHHSGKAEGSTYRGSTEIIGGVDLAFHIERPKDRKYKGGPVPLTLKYIKTRYKEDQPLHIEFLWDKRKNTFRDVTENREMERERSEIKLLKKIQNIIGKLNKPNQSELRKAIKKELKIGKNKALNLLSQGVGRYWKSEKKGESRIYIIIS